MSAPAPSLRLGDGELKKVSIGLSLLLHAALGAAILVFGALGALPPRPEPRSIDLVSIEELLPPPPELLRPEAAPLASQAEPMPASDRLQPPARSPETAIVQAEDPSPVPATSGAMALPASRALGGAAQSGAGAGETSAAASAAGAEPDYLPQFKISEVPVVPIKEVLSRIRYPPLAAKQGIEATVFLELFIDDAGKVRKVTVLKDPGNGFAEAAIEALNGITCLPAKIGAQSAAVRFRYPVRFTLK